MQQQERLPRANMCIVYSAAEQQPCRWQTASHQHQTTSIKPPASNHQHCGVHAVCHVYNTQGSTWQVQLPGAAEVLLPQMVQLLQSLQQTQLLIPPASQLRCLLPE